MKVGFHLYLMPWFAEVGMNANGGENWCLWEDAVPPVTSQSDICCLFMHPSTLFSWRSPPMSRNTSSLLLLYLRKNLLHKRMVRLFFAYFCVFLSCASNWNLLFTEICLGLSADWTSFNLNETVPSTTLLHKKALALSHLQQLFYCTFYKYSEILTL